MVIGYWWQQTWNVDRHRLITPKSGASYSTNPCTVTPRPSLSHSCRLVIGLWSYLWYLVANGEARSNVCIISRTPMNGLCGGVLFCSPTILMSHWNVLIDHWASTHWKNNTGTCKRGLISALFLLSTLYSQAIRPEAMAYTRRCFKFSANHVDNKKESVGFENK